MLNNKKNKLILMLTLLAGVSIGHGFPTLYQYIESLSGDYISNETSRNEILNSDIQTGEPMKASVMNAKFNSLKYELNELSNRVINLEGSSSGSNSVTRTLSCTRGYCLAIVKGKTQEDVANGLPEQEYLATIQMDTSPTAYIVARLDNAASEYGFDPSFHTSFDTTRVRASDVVGFFGCTAGTATDGFCLVGIMGKTQEDVANGLPEQEYLVSIKMDTTPSAYIVSRLDNAASEHGFDPAYHTGFNKTRIRLSEVTNFYACADSTTLSDGYCLAVVKGKTQEDVANGLSEQEYLVSIKMDTSPTAYIVARLDNAASEYGFDPAFHTGFDKTRIRVAEIIDFYDCAGGELSGSDGYCLAVVKGKTQEDVANGLPEQEYLVSIKMDNQPFAYIVVRLDNAASEYGFDPAYHNGFDKTRIRNGEIIKVE